jgi:hypothetical protein
MPAANVTHPYDSDRPDSPRQYSVAASTAREQTSDPSAFWEATSSGRKLSETRYSDTQTKVRMTELNGWVAQSHSAHA